MANAIGDLLVNAPTRDENGRFKAATPAESAQPSEATPPETKAAETPAPVKAPEPAAAPAPTPAPAQPAEQTVPLKALHEERNKRQQLERQLREVQQPTPPVDPWQDLPGTLTQHQQQLRDEIFVERCNLTEEIARDKHKDFDEVRAVFLEEAQNDPRLFQQLRQERNPAEYAYREGLRLRELKPVNGDITAYRTKLEKDIETRLRAEFEAKYGKQPETPVPTSLNSDSSPAMQTPVYQGPPPIGTLLRNASRR